MTNMNYPAPPRFKQGLRRGIVVTSLLLGPVGFLAGCGGMINDTARESVPGVQLQGRVNGGQNPVSGATIQLYAAQAGPTSTYGAAAVSLLNSPRTSGADGSFTITGDYTCPASPNDQVYLVATGGNSGAGANANIGLMLALGPCSGLSGLPFLVVNEVTTVASAYALSGFMTDYAHVGASSTNYSGLANAMATVNNLVNIATGQALSVTPAYASPATGTTSATFASTVPQAEINTLADIIAECVNNGVGGAPSSNCTSLFGSNGTNTTTGGATGVPDTIQAALNIAKHPGTNVAALFSLVSSRAPFPSPALTAAPNDWTIGLTFIGGGLGGDVAGHYSQSNALAIDASGDVWVSDRFSNSVTELSNLGAPISANTILNPSYTGGGFTGSLFHPDTIAIDLSGNAWLGNSNGTISEFTSGGSALANISGNGLTGIVRGVAIDGSNNLFAVDSTAVLVAKFNGGTAVSNSSADLFSPVVLAIDGSGNVWVGDNGNQGVVKFNNSLASAVTSGPAVPNAFSGLATDGSGQAWAISQLEDQLFVANDTSYNAFFYTSISTPGSILVDGAGNVWTLSSGGAPGQASSSNLTEMSSSGGSVISPNGPSVYGYGDNSGLILQVKAGGIDRSGNLWVLNGANSSFVTEFVGIAAPTYTPLAAAVSNHAIGARP